MSNGNPIDLSPRRAAVATGRAETGTIPRPAGVGAGTASRKWLDGWRLIILIYVIAVGILGLGQTGSSDAEMTHDSAHYLELARNLNRGDGYVTYVRWALNLPVGSLPAPDTYRAPLFPLLVAGFVRLTGVDYSVAGKSVSALTGAWIPVIVFLFLRRRFGLPVRYGLLGAAITMAHHHLMVSGTRALTETPYAAACLTGLFLVTGRRPAIVRAGIVSGLAILLRYQGIVLVPACLLGLALHRSRTPRKHRPVATYAAVALLTLSPWLVRNQIVAGSPLYTDLKYHLISSYDPDVSYYQYFHGLVPPPEPVGYLIDNLDRTTVLFVRRLGGLAFDFGWENSGNPLLLGFALLGVLHLIRRREGAGDRGSRAPPLGGGNGGRDGTGASRDLQSPGATASSTVQRSRTLAVFGAFSVLNVILVCVTFAHARHLTSLDPLVVVVATVGVFAVTTWLGELRVRTWARIAVLALLAAAVGLEGVRSFRKLDRDEPSGYQYAAAVAPILRERVAPDESVMAVSPYFFAYALDRPAVSLPWCGDEQLRELIRIHDVRYICIVAGGDVPPLHYPGSFLDRGVLPDWLRDDGDLGVPGLRVLEVKDPDSPRGAHQRTGTLDRATGLPAECSFSAGAGSVASFN